MANVAVNSSNPNDGSGSSRVTLKRGSSNSEKDVSKGKKGGKPPGPEWQFVTNLNKFIDWKCNTCGEVKSGGAPRIRDHFLGGTARTCGGKCRGPGASDAARRLQELLEKMTGHKKLKMSSANCQTPASAQSNIEQLSHGKTPIESNASPEFQVGSSKSRQTSLMDSFRATALEEAQLALAQAIFFSGASLSMVTRDAWKTAWKKIGEYGAGFTPPTYHHMRNQLLDKCHLNIKDEVQRLIISETDQSGCTIVSDGWSNVQRRPLINVMVVSPRGECFVKAVDSSGEIKSGLYIANIISETIEQVGVKNVVQVIMDNAKNCRSAGKMLEQRFPQLYASGCNTHSLNLVLQDWYKSSDTEWFKLIIDKARKVVKFIMKRQRVLDMYRMRMSTMLKLPCETRFCTNFYMMESLLRNKNAVMETFVCASFSEWEGSQSQLIKGKILDLRGLLSDRHFWDEVADAYHVVMPVMFGLRQLDSKLATIGKVWMTWWTIQESLSNPEEIEKSIVKPWKAPFSKAKRGILCKYVHARWVRAHSPLHSAAFLLDPEYWAMDIHALDDEVLEDFYDVVASFFPDSDDSASAITELMRYKLKEGRFSSTFVQKLATEQPAWKWWILNGGSVPTLRRLAIRVLAQCASNSSSERNWSTYKYVHSTVRNRLLSDRAEKLVYMYCNHRVIQRVESEDYTEEMPKWTYDVIEDEDASDANEHELGEQVYGCTLEEIEDNLGIDDSVERTRDRRWFS